MRLSLLDQGSQNPSKGAAAALGRNKGNCFLKSEWKESVRED